MKEQAASSDLDDRPTFGSIVQQMQRTKPNFSLTWKPLSPQTLNWVITCGSALLCSLLLFVRFPGLDLAGISPNWPMIWVVAWSVKRSVWQGALAGLALGMLHDALSEPNPSHILGLVCVGVITARLQKQKYIQEDFISIALIVFGMAIVTETITAIQFSLQSKFFLSQVTEVIPVDPKDSSLLNLMETGKSFRSLASIWQYHQRVALSSAILSSLWAPVIYYPLNRWWERFRTPEDYSNPK